MDPRKRCWFKGCVKAGEPRPLFATSHDLPATIRLCQQHMTVLSNDAAVIRTSVERPQT